jgi:hypothetical protein
MCYPSPIIITPVMFGDSGGGTNEYQKGGSIIMDNVPPDKEIWAIRSVKRLFIPI